jgi:hypothetical protein
VQGAAHPDSAGGASEAHSAYGRQLKRSCGCTDGSWSRSSRCTPILSANSSRASAAAWPPGCCVGRMCTNASGSTATWSLAGAKKALTLHAEGNAQAIGPGRGQALLNFRCWQQHHERDLGPLALPKGTELTVHSWNVSCAATSRHRKGGGIAPAELPHCMCRATHQASKHHCAGRRLMLLRQSPVETRRSAAMHHIGPCTQAGPHPICAPMMVTKNAAQLVR